MAHTWNCGACVCVFQCEDDLTSLILSWSSLSAQVKVSSLEVCVCKIVSLKTTFTWKFQEFCWGSRLWTLFGQLLCALSSSWGFTARPQVQIQYRGKWIMKRGETGFSRLFWQKSPVILSVYGCDKERNWIYIPNIFRIMDFLLAWQVASLNSCVDEFYSIFHVYVVVQLLGWNEMDKCASDFVYMHVQ